MNFKNLRFAKNPATVSGDEGGRRNQPGVGRKIFLSSIGMTKRLGTMDLSEGPPNLEKAGPNATKWATTHTRGGRGRRSKSLKDEQKFGKSPK